jgi:2-polyprenyl-3-methyl-5-hydroxy-6-metoxy-1,4-benzoquinol methylase
MAAEEAIMATDQPERTVARADVKTVKNAFEAPEWYFNKLNYRIRLRAEVIAEMTRDFNFNKYIDIGCGDGSISIQLLNQNRRLTLQDLSSAMLKRANSLVPAELQKNVTLVEGDFREAGLERESYDMVICLGVLSYIDELDPFLRQLNSLIKPGGQLIIECSDRAHPLSRLTAAYSWTTWNLKGRPKTGMKLQFHTSRTVESSLTGMGFKLQRRYRYSMPMPIIRAIFGQEFHYQTNRFLHGGPANPRLSWLGTECIFQFTKP